MKTLLTIVLLLCSFSGFAEDEFLLAFDIDMGSYIETADRVAVFYSSNVELSSAEQIKELSALAKLIDGHIKEAPTNPVLYFLKGLNLSLLSGHYANEENDSTFSLLSGEKVAAYRTAMQLDASNEPHLSSPVYSTMKYGLPDDLKVQAIQSELKLGGSGEDDSYYWFLHWSNISSLLKADRVDEANQALLNMKKELKEEDPGHFQYQLIVNLAQSELMNKKHKIKLNAKHSESLLSVLIRNKNILLWVIFISAIVTLILVNYYEFVIKRKRK